MMGLSNIHLSIATGVTIINILVVAKAESNQRNFYHAKIDNN